MKSGLRALVAVTLVLLATTLARADLLIEIDKAAQRMTVSMFGETVYVWPVSTGLRAHETPSGSYKPFRMERHHFSREWDDAPMPHSIFFTMQGHAIHGTNHLKQIGRPASHGCVRLEPQNAAILFALVRQEKMANTRVVLAGETPGSPPPAVASRTPTPLPPEQDQPRIMQDERGFEEFSGAAPRAGSRPPRGYAREYHRGAPVYYEMNGRLYAEPPPAVRDFYRGGRFIGN